MYLVDRITFLAHFKYWFFCVGNNFDVYSLCHVLCMVQRATRPLNTLIFILNSQCTSRQNNAICSNFLLKSWVAWAGVHGKLLLPFCSPCIFYHNFLPPCLPFIYLAPLIAAPWHGQVACQYSVTCASVDAESNNFVPNVQNWTDHILIMTHGRCNYVQPLSFKANFIYMCANYASEVYLSYKKILHCRDGMTRIDEVFMA